jgi:hypothetical protein
VKNRNSGQKNPVLASANDLAVSDNDGTKRSAPSFLDGLDGKPGGLVEELFFILVTFNICSAHVRVFFCVDCGVCLRGDGFVVFSKKGGTGKFPGVLVHITQISKRLQPISHKAQRQGVTLLQKRGMEIAES